MSVIRYRCESWKLTKLFENKLKKAQTSMGISMLGLRDPKMSTWVREQQRVGHIARRKINRWSKGLMNNKCRRKR